MRKGPLKLYSLIVSSSCGCPLCDLSDVRLALTEVDYILVSAADFCSDSYWWSSNLRTVMVFSFEKFPSKTLSSHPPPPCLQFCLSFLTFPLFLSHPPSHTVLLSSAFSLSYPCYIFSFLIYALLLLVTLSPGLGGSDRVVFGSSGNRRMELPFL